MINIKISKRLKEVASFVDNNSIVADIGCDHALLDIFLINNKISKKCIAIDNKKGAILNALKNINRYNINNIETRLSSGISSIRESDNVDTIILSGLGTQTILNILSCIEKLESIKTIIIQSNNDYYNLRFNMMKKGYKIIKEKLVLDKNIFYVIMKFEKGKKIYNKRQLFLGPYLLNHKDEMFNLFINKYIDNYKNIIRKLKISKILLKIKYSYYIYKLKRELK